MTEEIPSIDEDNFEAPKNIDFGDLKFGDEVEILSLIDLGKSVKEYEIPGGHKVLLQIPSHMDEIRLFDAIKEHKGTDAYSLAYRLARVAVCLLEIDGSPVFSTLKKSENENYDLRKKIEKLGNYHLFVIDSIYEKILDHESANREALAKLVK